MTTRTTGAGIHLIKRYERFSGVWYTCPAGVPTIAYGITEGLLPGVTRAELPGPIDGASGDALLRRALAEVFEPAIERLVEVPMTKGQFDALTSFTFNVGVRAFERSTLRTHLIARRYRRAADEFGRWIYGGGRILKGLVKRREAERRLFLGEMRRALEVRPDRLPPMEIQRAPIRLPRLERLRGHVPTASEVTHA